MKAIGTTHTLNTAGGPMKLIALGMLAVLTLTGCKLGISVFEGGSVQSTSGVYECSQGEACVVEIKDMNFHETFVALPATGYQFEKWTKGDGFHCGGSTTPTCVVSTAQYRGDANAEALIAGENYMYLQPQFKYVGGSLPPPIDDGGGSVKQACMTSPSEDYYPADSEFYMLNGAAMLNLNREYFKASDDYLMYHVNAGYWYIAGEGISARRADLIRGPPSCAGEELFTVQSTSFSGEMLTVNTNGYQFQGDLEDCQHIEVGHMLYVLTQHFSWMWTILDTNNGESCLMQAF